MFMAGKGPAGRPLNFCPNDLQKGEKLTPPNLPPHPFK